MHHIHEQYPSNKLVDCRRVFWMITGVLLSLVIKNVQSDEIPYSHAQHQIEISGFTFIPKKLSVSAGDTITWINKDIVPHNIIDSTHQTTISPDLAIGEKYTFVVKNPMLYQCGLHPTMKGKLSLISK